ncbi:MAG TPA: hypothetical protein VIU46_03405 [Gallionellaceae bacterium]
MNKTGAVPRLAAGLFILWALQGANAYGLDAPDAAAGAMDAPGKRASETAFRRYDGDTLLPYVSYDFARHHVPASGLYASDHRLEAGAKFYSLQLEQYAFDQAPAGGAALRMDRQMLRLRIPDIRGQNGGELDIGLGRTAVHGAQRTAVASLGVNLKLAFGEHTALSLGGTLPLEAFTFGFGSRSARLPMGDGEIALHLGMRYATLNMGYRYLYADHATYRGPYAGVSFHY